MSQTLSESILYKGIIEHLNEIVIVINSNTGCVEFLNSVAKELLGYTISDFNDTAKNWFRCPLNPEDEYAIYIKDLRRKDDKNEYAIIVKKDGSEMLVEADTGSFEHDGVKYNLIFAKDVTEKLAYAKNLFTKNQELQKSIINTTDELKHNTSRLQSYEQALDESSIVSITDAHGKITYVNKLFEDVSGFDFAEAIGKSHSIVRHPDEPREKFKQMWDTLQNKQVWHGRLANKKKNGDTYYVDATIVPILDVNGEIVEYIATRHDITELIKQKEELQKAAKTDSLTGLGNRFKLYDKINDEPKAQIALVDINGFHEINDFYGADFGDLFIKQFAFNILQELNTQYELFHLHGDEFAILNTTDEKIVFMQNMKVLNNNLSSTPLEINTKTFPISTTISLSFEKPENLLSTVNMAHSFGKKHKEKFIIYSEANSLEDEYAENIKWAKIIKQAIIDDRIVVYFQPIVDSASKKVVKYESLVRLILEDGTVVAPYHFLERAKKSGLYFEISKIVITKTLDKLGACDLRFSINITIEDILNRSFNTFLENKLKECECCNNLTFELVESEGIENFDEVNNFIQMIRSYGCTLAIDDFGTGYSNFEYLLKLSSDYVKIDGSLIKQIDINPDYYDIVKTIVEFAKIKKLKVIAEFVSNDQIYNKVLDLGIDYSQGYYFSEPRPL